MYDRSERHGNEARPLRGGSRGLGEVVLETRCHRCGSLIFAERLDPLALIPVGDDTTPMICASCSTSEGRTLGTTR